MGAGTWPRRGQRGRTGRTRGGICSDHGGIRPAGSRGKPCRV